MKRIPLVPTLALPLVLAVLATVAFLPSKAVASPTKSVTVDYVIALLDTGVTQTDIVARIKEKNLAFRLAPGDVDRLRAAGAGQVLIDAITNRAAVLENQESASPGEPTRRQERGGADTNGWGRPSRLGNVSQPGEGAATAAPSATEGEVDENSEGIEEIPDDGYYADSYYSSPGYYGFSYYYGYPYPYYYPSFYYPYGFYGYYSSPYYYHPHHFSRPIPRGGGSFHGVPRGGGGVRSAPHGGGGGRPAPRGSHHH